MKSALLGFLACLLLLSAQGQPAYRSNKCKCSHSLLSRVKLRSIQKEPAVYQPSTFCPQYEIIVKVADKEKCLDPKSHIGHLILKRHKNKLRKTEAVQTTTAPAQSSTTKQATSSSRSLSSELTAGSSISAPLVHNKTL